jgi:hypothetical protein
VVLKKIFKDFQFFNQWEAIFDIRQGQWTNLFPETTGTIILKRGRSVHLIVLIKVFSSLGPKVQMSFPHHFVSVVCHPLNFHILIFSRTTGSNWTKLWWEGWTSSDDNTSHNP